MTLPRIRSHAPKWPASWNAATLGDLLMDDLITRNKIAADNDFAEKVDIHRAVLL
jgi:hypothetical protein